MGVSFFFFFLPMCSCTSGELNFNPLCACVSVDAGRTHRPACAERRLLYLFNLALPGCCQKTEKKYIHAAETCTQSTLRSVLVTIVTFLVLKPLATSSFSLYMTYVLFSVLLVLQGRSLETLGEIALLSALCMFCPSLWEDLRGAVIPVSILPTVHSIFSLPLPHHCSSVFVEVSYHYAVLRKL